MLALFFMALLFGFNFNIELKNYSVRIRNHLSRFSNLIEKNLLDLFPVCGRAIA